MSSPPRVQHHQYTQNVETAARVARRTGEELLAGAVAGALAKTIIAPLDRTKIIFQTTHSKPFSWMAVNEELRRIVKDEGFAKLWRGHSATLSRVIPYAAIQFATFDALKRKIPKPPQWHELWLAGATAGAVSVGCTYPLDLMRARMAVGHHHGTVFVNLLSVYREHGIKTWFRGLNPTLLGILPYAGVSFASFETLKRKVREHKHNEDLTTFDRLSCGALAGFIAQSITYPLDIVRRRMQTESLYNNPRYQNTWISLRTIIAEEGYRALFKALAMNAVKGPIAVGVSFTTHDFILKSIMKR